MKSQHFNSILGISSLLSVSAMIVFSHDAYAQSCITWETYSRSLPSEGGRGNQWKAFRKLPSTFQNGCVLLQDNNSVDVAYVLKVGISPNPYKGRSFMSNQKVPSFNSEKDKDLERLVAQGKALQVTWLTPTNGSIPYLRSIPKDQAFLRKDGMTCFNLVCMKSGALSHRELSTILNINRAETQPVSNVVVRSLTLTQLQNAVYNFDRIGEFKLTNGEYKSRNLSVKLFNSANVDINGDGIQDAVVVLGVSGGGSGLYMRLVSVVNQGGQPIQKAVVAELGDRTKIEKITPLSDELIEVEMLSWGGNNRVRRQFSL